jgi:hypothetical protein
VVTYYAQSPLLCVVTQKHCVSLKQLLFGCKDTEQATLKGSSGVAFTDLETEFAGPVTRLKTCSQAAVIANIHVCLSRVASVLTDLPLCSVLAQDSWN